MKPRKIEGIALVHDETDSDPMFIAGKEYPPEDSDLYCIPATLVLHGSGEHKEVYTLQDIEAAFAKMGIVGSDTERDFQYLLRNL